MQTLYAYHTDSEVQQEMLRKNLAKNIHQALEIYLYDLLFLTAVADHSRRDYELRTGKHLPSEDDLLPTYRLSDNSIVQFLKNSEEFQRLIKKHKLQHSVDNEVVKSVYLHLRKEEKYRQYAKNETPDAKEERKILKFLVNDIMAEAELYDHHMEEHFQAWHDDADTSFIAVNLTIEEIAKNKSLATLEEFREKMAETEDFAVDLMQKTLQNADRNTELIAPKLQNWEVDRIALMDMILMRMALTEILDFPTIPVKVTINEYIDISKNYSTPKSKEFINGVLDKVMKELKEEGKIFKSGRGLLNK